MEKSRKLLKISKVKHPTLNYTFSFPPGIGKEHLVSALKLNAKPEDIFVCSFPKSGTTWMQNIVWLITRYGNPISADETLRNVSPCLEFNGSEFIESIDYKGFPRIIKTHLPYQFVPQNKEAKYIYIARNPKDTLVSYYYHAKGFTSNYNCPDLTLKEIYDAYLEGETSSGCFFDHVGAWYQKRNDDNVLFLLYEDLKKDTEANILKVIRFLGHDYEKRALADNEDILKRILDLSSFKSMKTISKVWLDVERPADLPFIRKGEVGDWKNHLTSEESVTLDEWIRQKGAPYEVDKLWKNHPEV